MGPVVTGRDVRLAVEQTLKMWLPSTLAHVCRDAGLEPDRLQVPREQDYHRMVREDTLTEVPPRRAAIVIASPADAWERDPNGAYRTQWTVLVSVACRGAGISANPFTDTVDTTDLYCGAVRLALGQHGALGDFASGVEIHSGGYSPVGDGDRTVMRGTIEISVLVDNTLIDTARPAEPPADPLAEPTSEPIETAHITTEPLHPVWS